MRYWGEIKLKNGTKLWLTRCTVYSLQYPVDNVQFAVFSVQSSVYSVQWTVYSVYLYTLHVFTFCERVYRCTQSIFLSPLTLVKYMWHKWIKREKSPVSLSFWIIWEFLINNINMVIVLVGWTSTQNQPGSRNHFLYRLGSVQL